MYKSFSMELAGRTLTVDVGRVAARQMALRLCIMEIPRFCPQRQLPISRETALISSR